MVVSKLLPQTRTERVLAVATLADSIGTGLYTTAGMLFFTHVVGLSAVEVGLGMALAGIAGFLAPIPLGHLADRLGARDVAMALAGVQAILMAGFALVQSFSGFLVVVALFCAAERGTWTARSAMVAGLLPGSSRVRAQAYMRSVFNAGVSVGALLTGAALVSDSAGLYVALMLGNAASFALYAVIVGLLPRVPPIPRVGSATARTLPVLRDLPYLSVGLLNGILSIHHSVLLIGLPLWLSEHTEVPRVVLSWLFLLNTAMAVLFQVRASRGSDTVRGAARALGTSAIATGGACLLFAPAAHVSALLAACLLAAGTVALTLGELLQSAGCWGLSFGLTKGGAHGSYQGGFSLGDALRDTLGPILVVSLAISHGVVGWLILGGMFVVAGALVAPAARWAQAHHQPDAVASADDRVLATAHAG
ncbi:MFS transporter [Saccharopolyspora sp. 5N708]|uniref:MFS transporter n=1 Tax=Saccharopolyspora sp. 5N708 TaxID=3457424 RepID=UPI003FD2FDEB